MDAEAIERFSGPPLAERAWISEQARACTVRPGTDDLESLVIRHLGGGGADGLAWDSWRRPDGRWTVVAAVGDDAPISTWVYDPHSRSVHPDDAASHKLATEDVVVPLRPSTSTAAMARPTQAVKEPSRDDTPVEHAKASDSEQEQPVPVVDDAAPAARGKAKKGRRASVPRWDEILFGSGESDS